VRGRARAATWGGPYQVAVRIGAGTESALTH